MTIFDTMLVQSNNSLIEEMTQTEQPPPPLFGDPSDILVIHDDETVVQEPLSMRTGISLLKQRFAVKFNGRLLVLLGIFALVGAKLYADWHEQQRRESEDAKSFGLMDSFFRFASKFY